jgi:DNA-binding ferritin-like protein
MLGVFSKKRFFAKKNTTKRFHPSSSMQSFQQEITILFFEMLITVKLFHWKTYSFATHKATDELYGKLNDHIDSFIEILLGKSGKRIDLTHQKNIRLVDVSNASVLKTTIERYKTYLVGLENKKALQTMSNTDLFNIRDEILGDLNQFLYLLTFK